VLDVFPETVIHHRHCPSVGFQFHVIPALQFQTNEEPSFRHVIDCLSGLKLMPDMIKSFPEEIVQCDFSRRFVLRCRLIHSSSRIYLSLRLGAESCNGISAQKQAKTDSDLMIDCTPMIIAE
jgi:hypothetical protein